MVLWARINHFEAHSILPTGLVDTRVFRMTIQFENFFFLIKRQNVEWNVRSLDGFSLVCESSYTGNQSPYSKIRFKMVHFSSKNAKFRVRQSQVCYLRTTHLGPLKHSRFCNSNTKMEFKTQVQQVTHNANSLTTIAHRSRTFIPCFKSTSW